MKKNKRKNQIICNANAELLKTQQLVINGDVKETIMVNKNKKLRKDIISRDQIEQKKNKPSSTLLDRIQSEQDLIDDLRAEIDSGVTETYESNDKLKKIISELRKTDPEAANKLENLINLKSKKHRTIRKKRL